MGMDVVQFGEGEILFSLSLSDFLMTVLLSEDGK